STRTVSESPTLFNQRSLHLPAVVHTSPVPDAWQPVGERLELPSERSGRLHVVGLLTEGRAGAGTRESGWRSGRTRPPRTLRPCGLRDHRPGRERVGQRTGIGYRLSPDHGGRGRFTRPW